MDAGKAYQNAREKLEKAKGFHFIHRFKGNVPEGKYSNRDVWLMEGNAICWEKIAFTVSNSLIYDGEWIVLPDIETKPENIEEATRTWRSSLKVFSYHRINGYWILQNGEAIESEAEEILILNMFGNRYRAIGDIQFLQEEEIEGENCNCYEWSLDAGGRYKLWISKRTGDAVRLYQAHPWASIDTIFSKIDVPVKIESPNSSQTE